MFRVKSINNFGGSSPLTPRFLYTHFFLMEKYGFVAPCWRFNEKGNMWHVNAPWPPHFVAQAHFCVPASPWWATDKLRKSKSASCCIESGSSQLGESGVLNLPYQVISIHVLEAAPQKTASLLSPSQLQLALTLLIWAVSLSNFSACNAHHRHYNTYETSQSRHSRLQTKALSSLLFHLKDFQLWENLQWRWPSEMHLKHSWMMQQCFSQFPLRGESRFLWSAPAVGSWQLYCLLSKALILFWSTRFISWLGLFSSTPFAIVLGSCWPSWLLLPVLTSWQHCVCTKTVPFLNRYVFPCSLNPRLQRLFWTFDNW